MSESAKAPDKMRVLEGYLYVDTYAFTVRHENPELLRWLNPFLSKSSVPVNSKPSMKSGSDRGTPFPRNFSNGSLTPGSLRGS